jgi:dihydroxyacetone kinase DhaKLM complex PTS-EIIA-like component DhaM
MTENVGIVIVSHSPDVARGTADMVRQIIAAIGRAWSSRGVAILVDLGGAETNSEMAIEMLPEARRSIVVVCNAPIVEGAVIAATEASGGATIEQVRRTAEELSPI